MNKSKSLTNNFLPSLLIKYSIIIIVLELVMRFAMVHILRFYQDIFPLESSVDYSEVEKINNVVRAAIVMILNIIVGIILLIDLDRRKSFTWILFGLTLLNPWMSIIFFLVWKTADRNI